MAVTDQQLVACCLDPESRNAAFAELHCRYQSLVYGVACSGLPQSDWDDGAQEVWIKVFRNLPRFDCTRPFTPWLRTVAKNTIRSIRSGTLREQLCTTQLDDECVVSSSPGPAEMCGIDDLHTELRVLVHFLARQGEDIPLRVLENEGGVTATARQMSCSRRTVQIHLAQLRPLLRTRLLGECQDDGRAA